MTETVPEPDYEGIARVKLSSARESQLVELCSAKTLTGSNVRANTRALAALVKLGFAIEITAFGERAWQITDTGRIRCTTIR